MGTMAEVFLGLKEKMIDLKGEISEAKDRYHKATDLNHEAKKRFIKSTNQKLELQSQIEDIIEKLRRAEEKRKYVEQKVFDRQLYLRSLKEYINRMTASQIEDSVDLKKKIFQRKKEQLDDMYEKVVCGKAQQNRMEKDVEHIELKLKKAQGLVKQLEERKEFLTLELAMKRDNVADAVTENDKLDDKAHDLTAAINTVKHETELYATQIKSLERNIEGKEKTLAKYIAYNEKLENNVREMLPCYMIGKQAAKN